MSSLFHRIKRLFITPYEPDSEFRTFMDRAVVQELRAHLLQSRRLDLIRLLYGSQQRSRVQSQNVRCRVGSSMDRSRGRPALVFKLLIRKLVGKYDMPIRSIGIKCKSERTGVKCRMNRMMKREWVVTATRRSPGR